VKAITKYASFDGQVFETEGACRAHETANAHKLLVGLSAEEIDRAIAGDQDDLAEALEAVGARIARARRERGDLKRRRAPKDAPAEAPNLAVEMPRPHEPVITLTETIAGYATSGAQPGD